VLPQLLQTFFYLHNYAPNHVQLCSFNFMSTFKYILSLLIPSFPQKPQEASGERRHDSLASLVSDVMAIQTATASQVTVTGREDLIGNLLDRLHSLSEG
jgi:hypothetical protein